MKSLAPNTLLQNRYLIVHLIGKGGMGDVYLAVDQRLGSAVALKRTFFSDDEMLGNAFEREAKTLARLRHAVLPKVSDHFVENDQQFLVMEHISGDDLSKRLESAQKPFPISWVLFWADQLLDALAYLHAHEPPILHRDIKPQNLKLTDENSIILLDFGLSKNTVGETRPMSGGSSTGSVVGYTPHYAPMEQIRGTGTNPRSDLYALSATLYQLLTNVVPPDALTRADALINGLDDPVIPISTLNVEVPVTVSAVILKGMEISQDKRFSTAREMQKELREAFTQIQNAMFANTVAFNLQNEQSVSAPSSQHNQPLPPTQEKTEAFNLQSLKGIPSVAQGNYDYSPQQKKNDSDNGTSSNGANYDATLRMDSLPNNNSSGQSADSLPKQSNLKTEVFLAGSNSFPSLPPSDFPDAKNESGDGNGNYSSSGVFGNPQSGNGAGKIEAPASVPLFGADQHGEYVSDLPAAQTDFFTNINSDEKSDPFMTFAPTRNYTQDDISRESFAREEYEAENFGRSEQSDSVPRAAPETAKKSGGKSLAIGGAIALLILVVGAVGSFLIYRNYATASVSETVKPTPQPTIEISPTPQPTVEAAFETNANANTAVAENENAVGNSNSEVADENLSNQSNSGATNSTESATIVEQPKTSRPAPTVVTPKQPSQVAVKNTPKTNQTQAPKQPTKPAEKKPTAPIILQ